VLHAEPSNSSARLQRKNLQEKLTGNSWSGA
jgi:hypothetical protein